MADSTPEFRETLRAIRPEDLFVGSNEIDYDLMLQSKKTHELVIRLPIVAIDDADARSKAKELLKGIKPSTDLENPDRWSKLQRLIKNREPIGIPL